MIAKLIHKVWALEPTYHNRMAAIVLSGRMDWAAYQKDRKEPFFSSVSASWGYDSKVAKIRSKSGLVAIIPIIGSMSRYGDYCSWGTEDIGAWVMEANADEQVSAIVLEINSPGGEVDGTEMLGEIVRQSAKPVVAYVAGMAASAAYWVASQASEIVMESETSSEVGSIGVLAMHIDAIGFFEKEGYKITIIRSEGSDHKALFNSVEPLTEEIIAETQASMTPIKNQFISTVKAGRPNIVGDVFSGKMFNGKDAIKNKMADRIGFLGDAVRRADLLARKNQ